MPDPVWKRSGFSPAVLLLCGMLFRWLVNGVAPTEERFLEMVGAWLSLLIYQVARPTQRADERPPTP